MGMTSRSRLGRRGIRLGMLAVVMLGLAVVAIPDADAATTPFASCEATQAVAVEGVTSPSPTCEFILDCDPEVPGGCAFAVSMRVNGTGQVAGTMRLEPVDQPAVWVGTPASAPSCSGLFWCSAGSGPGGPFVLAQNLVRVVCSGGGVAALESISCSATAFA